MPTTGTDSDREVVAAVEKGELNESLLDQRVDEFLNVLFDVTMVTKNSVGKFDEDARGGRVQIQNNYHFVIYSIF